MKKLLVALVVLIVALAYAAGFWPEHRRVVAGQGQIQSLQDRVAAAEDRLRIADLLGQSLRLSEVAVAKNYGEAAALSSSFFDAVSSEAARSGQPAVKQALERILGTRDQITTAIAQTDPSLSDLLREHERTLRQALGYSVGPTV